MPNPELETVILLAYDGHEVEVPRRNLVVADTLRIRGRYHRPESVLEEAPKRYEIEGLSRWSGRLEHPLRPLR
jgi:hypothetical protein